MQMSTIKTTQGKLLNELLSVGTAGREGSRGRSRGEPGLALPQIALLEQIKPLSQRIPLHVWKRQR